MTKQRRRATAGILGSIVLLLATAGFLHAQALTPVPVLDLARLSGTWYEIARLPSKRQKKCVQDVVMLIALGDRKNALQVVESCQGADGFLNVRNESGKALNKNGGGTYKIGLIWPFTRKYSVLAVGPEYEWFVVGSTNHKELRLFSRTSSVAADLRAQMEARAAAQGYATDKLISQPQTSHYATK